jgi:2-oxoglutarate dehydrogenase complex dehydrogenase (E1) component-like enzyme
LIQKKVGVNDNQPSFLQKKKSRFNKLNEAVAFESFSPYKVCGAKNDFRWRETIIPALDSLIKKSRKRSRAIRWEWHIVAFERFGKYI